MSCKRRLLIFLSILILPIVLFSYQTFVNPAYSHREKVPKIEILNSEMSNVDPLLNLLGKSFLEIKQVLGEPDEKGHSDWLGAHHYMLYRYEEGFIQFCSPEPIENEIAVSIILGPGQEVLGAKVGMRFPEIHGILGSPDFGPEIGLDDLYYMDYFGGEIIDQIPEVYISFVAVSVNSPTAHVFIKWEAFKYEETKIFPSPGRTWCRAHTP